MAGQQDPSWGPRAAQISLSPTQIRPHKTLVPAGSTSPGTVGNDPLGDSKATFPFHPPAPRSRDPG